MLLLSSLFRACWCIDAQLMAFWSVAMGGKVTTTGSIIFVGRPGTTIALEIVFSRGVTEGIVGLLGRLRPI